LIKSVKSVKPELLSPAGDIESLEAAVLFGADAVYLGGKFGLRSNAALNFDEIIQSVNFAHSHSVKVYLACNIVAGNRDADAFPEYVRNAEKAGVDAVIVSDVGLFYLAKTHAPNLPIHISTQAGTMNYAACCALHKVGAKRIILARETSLADIRIIRDNTPPELELEAFAHGAMCVSYSGRCLLSAYLSNRDANKGNCSQPCRWKYRLTEETRPNEYMEIAEDSRGSYILNSRDLCMIDYIKDMAEAGLTSLKIEGRAKTAYYTAVITNAYRAALDAYAKNRPLPEWARREVDNVSHRPYGTGFYFGEAKQYYESSGYSRERDFVATINDSRDGVIEITQRGYFTVSDYIEAVQPYSEPARVVISDMRDANGEKVEVANKAMQKLFIKCDNAIAHFTHFKEGTMLRRCPSRKT